jgi:threonylcarbamoyladenosine tRNA methylthiotransferase MtaB
MFLNSAKIIEEAGIAFTHIFPYSKREGTPAAKMPAVNGKIVKERARILRDAGESELQKLLQKQVGKKLSVIVENGNSSKSENFLDVRILNKGELVKSGDILEVEIVDVEGKGLLGNQSL